MQYSREDSLRQSLAIAFGDREASAAASNPAQNTTRVPAARSNLGLQPLAERLSAIEQRMEQARASGAIPAPAAMDERMSAWTTHLEREIGELEVKFKIQIEALNERDRAMVQNFAGEMASLRTQVAALQRELPQTMARLMEERVEAGVNARFGMLAAGLREALREEITFATLAAAVQKGTGRRLRAVPRTGGTRRAWPWQRAPLVCVFFAAACGLLLLHYL